MDMRFLKISLILAVPGAGISLLGMGNIRMDGG